MPVRWVEGYAPVSDIVKTLADKITNNLADTNWDLHYPATIDAITNNFVLSHTVGSTTVYIEFYKPDQVDVVPEGGGASVKKNNLYCLECKFGTGYTAPVDPATKGTWAEDTDSARARFSWFMSDTTTVLKSWLPIQYYISVTENRLALILAGDPSANFDDRLISFGYFGPVKSFEGVTTDVDGNFGMCVSSDASPFDYLTPSELSQYSDKTGTGVVDFNMLKTFTGFPMQAHKVAFTTPDEFVDKQLEGPSAYTKKYHMSPVYIFHGFDGYRGELDGVVATDRSTVVHLDEMIHNDTENNKKDIYKVFLVNAPHSVFNNSTNVLYGVAVLKSTEALV